MRRPVERTEERAGRNGDVDPAQRSGADAGRHQRSDSSFIPVALGDDARAQTGRQRVHLEMCRGAFDLIDQAAHVGGRHVAQPRRQGTAILPRRGERIEQAIDRAILAEEEQLVLAAEVMIRIGG